jgi:hypothetical protein
MADVMPDSVAAMRTSVEKPSVAAVPTIEFTDAP